MSSTGTKGQFLATAEPNGDDTLTVKVEFFPSGPCIYETKVHCRYPSNLHEYEEEALRTVGAKLKWLLELGEKK